jgi:uncharacterized protein (TIGR02301 family)
MMRRIAAVALAGALLTSGGAGAQGIFDLFGPDRPQRAPRPSRKIPRAAEPSRAEPKAKKRDAGKTDARKADAEKRGGATAANTPGTAEPKGANAPPPPYEPQLMRLSEVLGALAFLRDLCGAKDREDWRGEMSALLDAEAPDGPRREKLAAAFNRGFRGYELTYRVCTPNAATASSRYLDEAARISRDVAYRFGNP